MVSSLLNLFELYFTQIYIAHLIISLILAICLSLYTMKRFASKTAEIQLKDAHRLETIAHEHIVFRFLFKASLHKNNQITNMLFMFLFNYTMPIIGYMFSIWIAWYLKHVKYDKVIANTNFLNLDEFGISFLKVERIFGESSMIELMHSEYAPKSKKLKALSALSNNASPANLKVIRETLSSTDDEIRMFGYAIINKAEKALNVKINKQLERFNEAQEFLKIEKDDLSQKVEENKAQLADASKELAHLYWEMIYTELSHESLKNGFLEEVVKYLLIAKKYYADEVNKAYYNIQYYEKQIKGLVDEEEKAKFFYSLDIEKIRYRKSSEISTKLYVLMGRVYSNKKEYESAITEFTIAQELNTTDSSFILPYIAEIYFLQGNYKVVKSIMNKSKDLELNYTLYPIVEQWKVS